MLGATPVFVDVDPRTFQIDPAHLERRIAEVRAAGRLRPRALIGVDLFGQPADWPALNAIAAREGLFTIDDRAQSFGATPARRAARHPGGRDGHQLLPVASRSAPMAMAARCSPTRRARRAVPQPAHAWRGHDALRGAAHRHERPAGLRCRRRCCWPSSSVFDEELARARAHRRASTTRGCGNALDDPGARAGQHQRLGDLFRPAARRRGAGADAGGAARGRGADRDLLSAPAAPAAGLSRRITTARALPVSEALASASWRCRSIPICRRRRWRGSATRYWRGAVVPLTQPSPPSGGEGFFFSLSRACGEGRVRGLPLRRLIRRQARHIDDLARRRIHRHDLHRRASCRSAAARSSCRRRGAAPGATTMCAECRPGITSTLAGPVRRQNG